MGLFDTGWTYYSLKRGWRLYLSHASYFHCPIHEQQKAELEKQGKTLFDNYEHTNSGFACAGDKFQQIAQDRKWTDANGDKHSLIEYVYKTVRKDRDDLVCKCGSKMEFRGFPTYLEHVSKEGKLVGGLFEFGAEAKKLPTKYFKTRRAQSNYITKILSSKYNK
jgi:hypothetical protein